MSEQERESSGWQLERSAAEQYEEHLVPLYFAPWAKQLVDRAALHKSDRVLDVACGTGIVARRAAERVGDDGSVVGLDINEGMLAVAEKTAAGSQPSIEWRHGDAADLPFPDEHFDVVFCQQALQYFDDPTDVLREVRRVLVPSGRFLGSVWRPIEYFPGDIVFAEALERHFGVEAGEMMRSPYPEWHVEYLRTLASDAGFGDVSITIEIRPMRYHAVEDMVRPLAGTPMAAELEDEATQEALVQDLEESLSEFIDDEGIVYPIEAYVITAQP